MTSTGQKLHAIKRYWLVAPLSALLLVGVIWTTWGDDPSNGEKALATVVERVEKNFSQIEHLNADNLHRKITDSAHTDTVVFDVREVDEFQVSHIAGATRVDPGISTAEFMKRFGDKLKGKDVVFYCSVGVRSSQLAAAVKDTLAQNSTRKIYNLKGGIFGWHNRKMSVVNASGKTDLVHPFNEKWGRLVIRADKRAYSPL